MAPSVNVEVTPDDVAAAVQAYVTGTPLDRACPLAIAAQRQIERGVRVFRNAWHLAGRQVSGKPEPATYGERLPADAVAYIADFDAWAKAVRSDVLRSGDLSVSIAAVPGQPAAASFVLTVPARPLGKAAA